MNDELQNYRLQLQQVEAALLTDPDNQELQKLKYDLDEVIELSLDLKSKAEEAANQPEYTGAVGVPPPYRGSAPIAGSTNSEHQSESVSSAADDDEITKSLLAVEKACGTASPQDLTTTVTTNKGGSSKGPPQPERNWREGDICLAKWADNNGQYCEARIDSIDTATGLVNVTFEAYKNRGHAHLDELREYTGQRRVLTEAERLKRIKMSSNRDYMKKKKQKKQQRFKDMEEERETDKNKWLAFASKTSGRAKKVGLSATMRKQSIFASPDSVNGRVGIGTCGMSGRPMTEFAAAEKWRKGT